MNISAETLKQMLEQKSREYNDLKYKYKLLEDKCNELKEELEQVTRYYYLTLKDNENISNEKDYILNEYSKLLNSTKSKHNERNAGRKAKFTELEIETMKMYKMQGMRTRAIAEMFGCSHTTVNKLIK